MCPDAFFPTAYPDEDFRSVVFRYHVRTGYMDFKSTNLELFEANSDRNPHIPRNLNAHFDKLSAGQGMSVNEILNNNTLWPLIRPFLSNEQIEQNMHEIQFGVKGASNFAMRPLSGRHRILSSKIRYCPQCLVDDFDRYGECFVHRCHQIDPIDVCHLHRRILLTHCPVCNVELSNRYGSRLLVVPQCSAGHNLSNYIQTSSDTFLAKLELYRDVQIIMESSNVIDRQELSQRFQMALASKGYILLSSKIKRNELLEDVKNILSNSTTEMVPLPDYPIVLRGICKLLRGNWNILSLPTFVFLMRLLCGSVEKFLHGHMSIATPIPFGSGPWPCVNRICEDYNSSVIKNCERKIIFGNTVSGKFICPICGCTYYKRWTLGTYDNNQRPKIITMGPLWEAKLIELSNQELSYSEIARLLKTQWIHIVNGIKRLDGLNSKERCYMKPDEPQLALKELAFGSEEVAATMELNHGRLERNREIILKLMGSESSLLRLDIARIAPGAFVWLMKNDRRWLEEILPKPQVCGTPRDWKSIDQELVGRVKTIVEKIYANNPQKRIVRYVIINACSDADRCHLNRGPTKVPQAWALLLQYEESKDDYLIRHIPALVEQLLRAGYTNVTLNSIMAFRRSYRGCSQRVRSEIVMILRNMGFQDVERGMDRYL